MRITGWHVLAWSLSLAWGAAALPQTPRISEIRIMSSDLAVVRYFELAGPPGAELEGMTYLAIAGGVVEEAIDLDGLTIPDDGYLLVSEAELGIQTDHRTTLDFEHGGNSVHMLVRGFRGSKGDNLGAGNLGTFEILDRVAWKAEPPDGPGGAGPVPEHAYRCRGGWRAGATDDTPGRPGCCFWPKVVPPLLHVEVWEEPSPRREPRTVSSHILSNAREDWETICDDCPSATFKRCCIVGEILKAEPGNAWYYHSRELACTQPVAKLAVKRRRSSASSRWGWLNPSVLDLSYEYRFGCDLGLEIAGIFADAEAGATTPRRIWAVALNVHPWPRGPLDVYFGPLVAYLDYDALQVDTPAGPRSVPVDDETALGINLGLSVPLPGRSYGITVGGRYMVRSSAIVGNVVDIDRELWELSAGLTWRF